MPPAPHSAGTTHADQAAAGPAGADPAGAGPPGAAGPDPARADSTLTAEREHLRSSREYLRLMREDVLSLRALAGDPVSEEYLKADLYRRAEALKDLPDTPLFFGRLNYSGHPAGAAAPGAPAGAGGQPAGEAAGPGSPFAAEQFHVGRRHVHDGSGRAVVVDWRAPVSRPFYRASQAEPLGLDLRRRFGFSGAQLTAYEDERFGAAGGPAAADAADVPASRILIDEIERPRSGPMRDIVATIQPDQDDIVRTAVEQTLCVQGAPGTGKTAVGLHRVAYLLYAYAEKLSRGGVLVIGPNRAFLAYIRHVLPALGELNVAQQSVGDLMASVPVRGTDTARAATVKGDARMAGVLRRALWDQLAEPAEAIVLPRGSRRWRVSAYEISGLISELHDRGVRYGTGRDMLGHRIAHVILTKMEAAGESCDDRTHDAVRRTRQVRAAVDAIWPKADPVKLVFRLLSDPDLLARAAEGVLDAAEQAAISWAAPPRGPGSARWSAADTVLIDEARDLIERTPSLAHVVVDEAQDLSPMECRAIGRRCATGSATVLGDLAQGTTPWATASWPELLGHLGKQDADLRILETGYRVPRQILDFASRLLDHIAPGLGAARSVRQEAGSLAVRPVAPGALDAELAAACRDALTRPGSAAVIAADDQVAELAAMLTADGLPHVILDGAAEAQQLTLVPVTLAKGLEFDQVIVVEPARIAAAEDRGLHRLYVALTRAVSRLTVLHADPLPAALA
ncbi:MAG TPA: ATP-binding domain-containing protein [Streptosporangiaceae bacterium]|nr:ATP-binding domain-containing protein [Streptosporangiaceae bacterium]